MAATKSDITDSWISTKVKSTYIYSSNIDASQITVSTQGGVVSLSGKLDSGAQRALAIELAENVRGVKRAMPGDFLQVRVTGSLEHDLHAELVA